MAELERELSMPVGSRDHALGPPDAPVTLRRIWRLRVPLLRRAFPIVKRLRKEMGNQLRVVFRHFPQNSVHPQAGVAAQAAESAAAQGKFWQMHELLFKNQADLADIDFTHYALSLGLEVYRFQSDLEREVFAPRVAEDFRSGLRSGVNATPTFFINGVKYTGPLESLRSAVLNSVHHRDTENTEKISSPQSRRDR